MSEDKKPEVVALVRLAYNKRYLEVRFSRERGSELIGHVSPKKIADVLEEKANYACIIVRSDLNEAS